MRKTSAALLFCLAIPVWSTAQDCGNYSLRKIYDDNDVVVEGKNISASLSYQQYIEYQSGTVPYSETEGRAAYDRYIRNPITTSLGLNIPIKD